MKIQSSIRWRLLCTMFVTLLVLSAGASTWTYVQARSDINALLDYEMEQMAYVLGKHLSAHPDLAEEPLLNVENDFVTQVWRSHNELLVWSVLGRGPDRLLPAGFSEFRDKRRNWRTLTMPAGEYTLQLAQPMALRRKLAARIATKAMLPVAATAPIGALIIWLVVGYGLRPLRAIAREVKSREPTTLRPIAFPTLPHEVAPLVSALNNLLERLDHALKFERQFIADASHELRSPVTALDLQVELLETAATPEERAESIADIKRGVARMTRLLEQILTLARLDPENIENSELIDLNAALNDIHDEFAEIAAARSIRVSVSAPEHATVYGEVASVRALLRNIVDNALRYTPENGTVAIQIENRPGGPRLRVIDSGPGIPVDIRDKIFSRFFREHSVSEDTGTGLGLAIAKRAAERLGARLAIEDNVSGEGVTFVIDFRRALETQHTAPTTGRATS